MSTDFMLYALDEADLPNAREAMASSLGYGNTDMASVIDAARRQQASVETMLAHTDVYERSSFEFGEHTTFHGDEEFCLAHTLVDVIGHDLPILDYAMARSILDALPPDWHVGVTYIGHETKPPYKYRDATHVESKARLTGWLEGARGRHLWYAFI